MLQERILIVEDEPNLTPAFVDNLTSVGFDTSTASDGEVGIQMLGDNNYDIFLIDLYLPKADGFQVLAHLQRVSSSTGAIVMTGHASIVSAVEAMEKGAINDLTKPLAFDQLRIIVKKALDVHRLQEPRASGQPSMTGSTVSPAGVPSVSIMNAPDAFHHALTASSETW